MFSIFYLECFLYFFCFCARIMITESLLGHFCDFADIISQIYIYICLDDITTNIHLSIFCLIDALFVVILEM
jgi:hypothetical protein